jgi:hypothetical protein
VVKTTEYFKFFRHRPDRAISRDEWIRQVLSHPEFEQIQFEGRIRRWARIREMDDRSVRVVLLEDGETVHNAFFDRGFKR